jgi:hypothetical protein
VRRERETIERGRVGDGSRRVASRERDVRVREREGYSRVSVCVFVVFACCVYQ